MQATMAPGEELSRNMAIMKGKTRRVGCRVTGHLYILHGANGAPYEGVDRKTFVSLFTDASRLVKSGGRSKTFFKPIATPKRVQNGKVRRTVYPTTAMIRFIYHRWSSTRFVIKYVLFRDKPSEAHLREYREHIRTASALGIKLAEGEWFLEHENGHFCATQLPQSSLDFPTIAHA